MCSVGSEGREGSEQLAVVAVSRESKVLVDEGARGEDFDSGIA